MNWSTLNSKRQPWYLHFLLFGLLCAGLSFLYHYPDIYRKPPQSAHLWRQADCASIARNYYTDGLNPFQPRMHNIFKGKSGTGGDGMTVGEFPVLYYLAAILYQLFGFHEGLFRLLNLIFTLSGLYVFSLIVRGLSQSFIFSILVGGLFFTSPLLAFYSFNFLPDAPAFGFLCWSLYYFYRYFTTEKVVYLKSSFAWIALAGLLKITLLIPFIALLILLIGERAGWFKMRKEGAFFKSGWSVLPHFMVVCGAIMIWYMGAKWYNSRHSSYLLMDIMPLWKVWGEYADKIWKRIVDEWYLTYFYPAVHLLMGLGFLYILIFYKKQHPFLRGMTILTFFGVLGAGILWFEQLYHHDYYVIAYLSLYIMISITTIQSLNRLFPGIFRSWWVNLLAGTLFVCSALHAREIMEYRYNPEGTFLNAYNASFYQTDALQAFMREQKISRDAKVISLPDISTNASLYHMQRNGLTHYNYQGDYNASRIRYWAHKGFEYLVISDTTELKMDSLRAVMQFPAGVFNGNLWFYDIRPYSTQAPEEEGEKMRF